MYFNQTFIYLEAETVSNISLQRLSKYWLIVFSIKDPLSLYLSNANLSGQFLNKLNNCVA